MNRIFMRWASISIAEPALQADIPAAEGCENPGLAGVGDNGGLSADADLTNESVTLLRVEFDYDREAL